jgi:murein peptide amidase A
LPTIAATSSTKNKLVMVTFQTTEIYPHKLRRLYWPFLALAEVCQEIVGAVAGSFDVEGKRYTIPSFVFRGPATRLRPIRLGLFALLHGDEPAGALGLERLLSSLANHPAPARGYELSCYPLCNPTGYEDGTRHNRAGFNLNREFWHGSALPEIKIIEDELRERQFDGIIALHSNETSNGLHGYIQGRGLNEHLPAPLLRTPVPVSSPKLRTISDGFAVMNAPVEETCPGVLAPPPEQNPRPFRIVYKTAAGAPMSQQVEAISCALRSVLAAYRGFPANP